MQALMELCANSSGCPLLPCGLLHGHMWRSALHDAHGLQGYSLLHHGLRRHTQCHSWLSSGSTVFILEQLELALLLTQGSLPCYQNLSM